MEKRRNNSLKVSTRRIQVRDKALEQIVRENWRLSHQKILLKGVSHSSISNDISIVPPQNISIGNKIPSILLIQTLFKCILILYDLSHCWFQWMLKLQCNFAYWSLLGELENHTNLGVTCKYTSKKGTSLKKWIVWLRTIWNVMLSKKFCFQVLTVLDSYTQGYALNLLNPMWYGTTSLCRILHNVQIQWLKNREERKCKVCS